MSDFSFFYMVCVCVYSFELVSTMLPLNNVFINHDGVVTKSY